MDVANSAHNQPADSRSGRFKLRHSIILLCVECRQLVFVKKSFFDLCNKIIN